MSTALHNLSDISMSVLDDDFAVACIYRRLISCMVQLTAMPIQQRNIMYHCTCA
jgi:hypothetical protein